ncbi:hypothetical protein BSL78_02735 [Apostichopus japonicus]|uniref:Uncharacterized protein n=1 Tax=Stichopus japonicus TaxID=307972 RepID=A0A2G8LJE0_STIJA|nr:hypothetical protein BSL78_02735 [Apostichopus japonicus]
MHHVESWGCALAKKYIFRAVISAVGYSTTHVANGYFEPIYVKVDAKELTSQEMSIGVGVGHASASATVKSTYGNLREAGFAKVFPLNYHGSSLVQLCLYLHLVSLSGVHMAKCQTKGGYQFHCQYQWCVVKAQYGTIWSNGNGIDIKPSQTEVDQAAIAQEAKTSSSGTSNRFVKTYFWAVQMCLTLILLAHFC